MSDRGRQTLVWTHLNVGSQKKWRNNTKQTQTRRSREQADGCQSGRENENEKTGMKEWINTHT